MKFLNPVSNEFLTAENPQPPIRVIGKTCERCSGQELLLVEQFTSRSECLTCGTLRLAAWTSHLTGIMKPSSSSETTGEPLS